MRKGLSIILALLMMVVTVGVGGASLVSADEVWQHVSDAEKAAGNAAYDAATDTITFPTRTSAWSARMIYTLAENLQGKNIAVELDVNLTAGILTVLPAFEDAQNFAGVGLQAGTGSSSFEGVCYSGNKAIDDFYYRDKDKEGNPKVIGSTVAMTNNRLRFEFYNGIGGTLAGGCARVLAKAADAAEFALVAEYDFPEKYTDNAQKANRLAIELVLGTGTVSHITVEELAAWQHVSDTEKTAGNATYDIETDAITFPTKTSAWSARMTWQMPADLQGKNIAVECDVNLTAGILTVLPAFEDAQNFAGVGLQAGTGSSSFEGVCYSGNKAIDDFYYRDKDKEGNPKVIGSTVAMTNNRLRFEFYNGPVGTLAGGCARVLAKATDAAEFTLVAQYDFPEKYTDNAQKANRLAIELVLGTGSVSHITVEEIAVTGLPVNGDFSYQFHGFSSKGTLGKANGAQVVLSGGNRRLFLPKTVTDTAADNTVYQGMTLDSGLYELTFDTEIAFADDSTEGLLFGVVTDVAEDGTAAVGDAAKVLGQAALCKAVVGSAVVRTTQSGGDTQNGYMLTGTPETAFQGTVSVLFEVIEARQTVYMTVGCRTAIGDCYLDNFTLTKKAVPEQTVIVTESTVWTPDQTGWFVPYGAAYTGDKDRPVYCEKGDTGFEVTPGESMTVRYFKRPDEGGVTTFGSGVKAKTGDTAAQQAGIQFGSYTETAAVGKDFGTLMIREWKNTTFTADDVAALTEEQKAAMVTRYQKAGATGWAKMTIGGVVYSIAVVPQKTAMWSSGEKRQYAVRLYGDYENTDEISGLGKALGDVLYYAIGYGTAGENFVFSAPLAARYR